VGHHNKSEVGWSKCVVLGMWTTIIFVPMCNMGHLMLPLEEVLVEKCFVFGAQNKPTKLFV
jgi:hypothetical protein